MKQLFFCMTALLMLSCTKSSSDSFTPTSSVDSFNKTSSSAAKVAVNNNWVEYSVSTNYMNKYVHWCQLWSSPLSSYEKQNACGPTAYMLAAHMVAAAHGYTFMPCTGTKLKAIVTSMGMLPISMDQISSHILAHDSPPLISTSYVGSSRTAFKSFLESELCDGNPVIVPIMISTLSPNEGRYCSTNPTSNYDIDSSPQTGRPNYILTSKLQGGFGHFVVVTALHLYTPTGNGLVFYKDPLATTGTTKVCSYSRFLESARINGNCTEPNCFNYDAIAVQKL